MTVTLDQISATLTTIIAQQINLPRGTICEVMPVEDVFSYVKSQTTYDDEAPSGELTLVLDVLMGGHAGGNYRMDSSPEYCREEGAENIDMEALDILCTECIPDLLFREYKTLRASIKTRDYHITEYYGNGQDRRARILPVQTIVDMVNAREMRFVPYFDANLSANSV